MKRLLGVLPALALLSALALRLLGLEAVDFFQFRVFDAYQRLRPRAYRDAAIRIIDLDNETLARAGQWPWPRTLVARLVDRLREAGAASIAFDIVFAEPDRTSPHRVMDSWPRSSQAASLRQGLARLPDHDQVLAQALGKANAATGFAFSGDIHGGVPELKTGLGYGGDSPLPHLFEYPGAVVNLPVLESAAAGNGNFGLVNEVDGVIRRVPLLVRMGKNAYPSLSVEALRLAQGAKAIKVKSSGARGEVSFGEHTGITSIQIGAFAAPTDPNGRMWVYYTAAAPGRTIPAWKVLEGKSPPEGLEGVIAFIGTSAAGLKDMRTTPLAPAQPGVEVHANVAEQVLLKDFLQRPDWATGAEVIFLLALGLGLIFLLPRLGAAWCAVLSLACVGGALAFSWHAFKAWGWLLDPVFPALVVLAVYLTSSLIAYLKTESEKKQIRGAFSRYLSPVLVEQLAAHPEKLVLGGEMREMTFHFCDIRGFTTISEKFDPHGLTAFINRFLTPMTEIILKHNGTIDKYIGDCIMAYWNAPLDDPEHARNACRAALEMHAKLDELNALWRAEADGGKPPPEVHIGTGLNTGPCVVGNMGSDQRFDYSVLGDDVNLASRLEGQSKTYGAKIVIGPKTRAQVPEFAAIELDLIRVKGKTQPVRIFTLLGGPELESSPRFRDLAGRHVRMLEAYRLQRWEPAEKLIGECRGLGFDLNGLYDLYQARINAYRSAPPEPDWDGVFTATTK